MAPAWPRADKEAQDGHEPRHIRARDIGIIIGCVVAIMILAHVVARLCGIRICGRRRRESAEDAERPVYFNEAHFLRYCAQRDQRLKKKEDKLINEVEIDIVAPVTAHKRTSAGPDATSGSAKTTKTTTITIELPQLPPNATLAPKRPRMGEAEDSVVADSGSNTSNKSSRTDSVSSKEGSVECCICLEGFKDQDLIRSTLCLHTFHSRCLETWLMKHHPRCPLCQENLKPEQTRAAS